MTTNEHRTSPAEKAYMRLRDKEWDRLSESARTIIGQAESAAFADTMARNYCYQQEEYEEAMENMRLAAAQITKSEHRLLAKLWRAALGAAASIDADDYETLAGFRAFDADLHYYYRMISSMIEETLQEKDNAELQREISERKPPDPSDLPF